MMKLLNENIKFWQRVRATKVEAAAATVVHAPLVLEYSETRSLREKGCAFERYNNINNETIDDHVEHVWTCCDSILYMDPTSRLTWTVNVQLAQQTVFVMESHSGEKLLFFKKKIRQITH